MSRVGIFGGTFDPVHFGHIEPSLAALETFRLDALVLVPAGRPPHKLGEQVTSFSHRFAMLILATHSHLSLLVSDLELAREGPSYTFDTLRSWQDSGAGEELFFLMGSDSFAQITTWHRWQELVDLAHLVVLHRQGDWGKGLLEKVPEALHERLVWVQPGEEVVGSGGRRIYMLDHEPVPTSATGVRERLRQRLPVAGLVPVEVEQYIEKYELYRDADRGYDGT